MYTRDAHFNVPYLESFGGSNTTAVRRQQEELKRSVGCAFRVY